MYSDNEISNSTQTVDANLLQHDNLYLFVSSNTSEILKYQIYFPNSYVVENFAEAKKIITIECFPELIVLDIPLNQLQLVEFRVWLTTINQSEKIPVVYNESSLIPENLKKLYLQGLIDDVVNLEENYTRLPYKVKFIQKLHAENTSNIEDFNYSFQKKNVKSIVMRAIDIIVSLVAILSLVPLFILIAIAIKVETKGPVFYRSLRAGRGFKVFSFYKFRTMIINADKIIDNLSSLNIYSTGAEQPHFFKIKDDPRITKVGTFLRNSSIDELPQLFNVLLGDMSIVGNRPLPLYEATTLTTDEWSERFMAPAGITGLWQISKRGQAEMSNEERILLDINYARYRTLKGDLKILIKTPSALIQKANV